MLVREPACDIEAPEASDVSRAVDHINIEIRFIGDGFVYEAPQRRVVVPDPQL
jgi:hypothetical protein